MLVMRMGGKARRIDELEFSRDGRWIAAPAGSDGLHVWAGLTAGAKSKLLTLPVRSVSHVSFSPDGQRLFAGNDELCGYQLPDGPAEAVPVPRWATLRFGASAGGLLVVCERVGEGQQSRISGFRSDPPGTRLWSVETATLVFSAPLFLDGGETFCVIEWGGPSGTKRVTRSARDGAVVEESPPLSEPPDRVALSPDSTRLACVIRDAILVIPAKGWADPLPQVRNDNKKHFTGVAFHPSGRFIAATGNDTTVKLYDTSTWAVSKTFTWGIGRLRSVAFSLDGTLAAVGSDAGKVLVWDVDF